MGITQRDKEANSNLCTGCGVCANICPSGSISMSADDEGFLYPVINSQACTGCQECERHCPVAHPPGIPESRSEPAVFAAWSLNEETRYKSTSGGIFTELAKAVIRRGGYVAGARYNSRHLIEHAMIENEQEIGLLRQSKYAQSDTKDIFKRTGLALQTGKPVLFVGTPCQCAGLSAFLRKGYENLILCDFICRGANSPMVYLRYLDELEAQYGSSIKQVWFKNKTLGWNRFCTKVVFDNGKEYLGHRDTDPFMYGYIKRGRGLYIRQSCRQCGFKGIKRPVDITLGDFWGIRPNTVEDDGERGISAILLHTEKARQLFLGLADKIFMEQRELTELMRGNICLTGSVERGKSKAFWDSYHAIGFANTIGRIRNGEN